MNKTFGGFCVACAIAAISFAALATAAILVWTQFFL